MPYTSVQQMYDDIEDKFPDNTSRVITPAILRQVMHDVAEFFVTYHTYKPKVIPLGPGPQLIINLTADLLQEYGRFPEPMIFFGDEAQGYVYTAIPWSVDKAPDNTGIITVEIGPAPPAGFCLLK